MILSDRQIRDLGRSGLIEPFEEDQIRDNVVSYGLSSFGYDVRLAEEFIYFEPYSGIFDIHQPEYKPEGISIKSKRYVLTPGEMILARTFEYIRMPETCTALCIGKSTYARQGLFVNTTPIEAAWEGFITLELSNVSNCPIALYANEGIAQLMYFCGQRPIKTYMDKDGKYQKQLFVTEAKL